MMRLRRASVIATLSLPAESYLTGRLCRQILARIGQLAWHDVIGRERCVEPMREYPRGRCSPAVGYRPGRTCGADA